MKANFRTKKSLGQHFLFNHKILNDICSFTNLKNKTVVEVGPGTGNLTQMILEKKPKRLIAIEKDKRLQNILENLKKIYPNKLDIIFSDAKVVSINELVKEEKIQLIANLPYNVASTLVINWLKYINIFENIIIMVQKEVAERFFAPVSSKSYGRLSVLLQTHANVSKIFDVSPDNFKPRPKVFSTVVHIKPKEILSDKKYKKLDDILKLSFFHRRKNLKNNLKQIKDHIDLEISKKGINPLLRPQDITPSQYLKLSELLI